MKNINTLLIILFFISFSIIYFSNYRIVKAETILFVDNFNDNLLNTTLWNVKNFTTEESGSFSPYSELTLEETNNEIKIYGEGDIDTVNLNGVTAGNIGKSLIYNYPLTFSHKTTVETEAKLVTAAPSTRFSMILTLEFDENNRILLNVEGLSNNVRQIKFIFEEDDNIRCPINNEAGCSSTVYNFANDQVLTLKITADPVDKKVVALVNDQIIAWGIFNGDFGNARAGIAGTVRDINQVLDARFDNFKITDESVSKQLNVPSLKQTSNPWGDLTYDHADKWDPVPSNTTISRWGCALTSASMILKYYGHDINPDALNEYLTANKGYTRAGGVIWPSVSYITKVRNNVDLGPILEFSYLNYSESVLKDELNDDRPSILKLNNKFGGNHFIVAKGYDDTKIDVNDPGSDDNETLEEANDYWGSTLKIGQFKKSETDLSYIVLYVDKNINLKVSNEDGEIVGDEYYFQEGPYVDPANPNSDPETETLNAFYYPKPESGKYKVEVAGEGDYQLDVYTYDIDGNIKLQNINDSVNNNEKDEFLLLLDKSNSDKNVLVNSGYSFEEISENIENLYQLGNISDHDLYMSLLSQIKVAKMQFEKEKLIVSKVHLLNAKVKILFATPEYINEEASEFLQNQIDMLIDSF